MTDAVLRRDGQTLAIHGTKTATKTYIVISTNLGFYMLIMYLLVSGKKKISGGSNLMHDLDQCLCYCVFFKLEVRVKGSRKTWFPILSYLMIESIRK